MRSACSRRSAEGRMGRMSPSRINPALQGRTVMRSACSRRSAEGSMGRMNPALQGRTAMWSAFADRIPIPTPQRLRLQKKAGHRR